MNKVSVSSSTVGHVHSHNTITAVPVCKRPVTENEKKEVEQAQPEALAIAKENRKKRLRGGLTAIGTVLISGIILILLI